MLNQEKIWLTAVQVATVWTDLQSARSMDAPGTNNPTNMDQWIESLTYETNLALCEENRVQTQLLYGEPVIVTALKDDWAQVVIPSQPSKKDPRGYPGWVPHRQLKQVKKSTWQATYTAIIMHAKAWLENEAGEQIMKLSYLTCLPVARQTPNSIEVKTPHGNHFLPTYQVHIFPTKKGMTQSEGGKAIVQAVEPFIGLSYFWGGMSAFGYDCSGLAYAAHKANGHQIGRATSDQIESGKEVTKEQIQTGSRA